MKDKRELYRELLDRCPDFELKGKNNLYTSANGHMFSFINKDNEFGIRFSKEVHEKYMAELNSTYFKSYGAVMKGYVLMPEELWDDLDKLAEYMNESYAYVLGLEGNLYG